MGKESGKYSSTHDRAWASPVFRWAGSKRKLLSKLIASTPCSYNTYIEPFAGSACYFFAIKPQAAILGDINSDLISAYAVLRKHPRKLYRAVSEMPSSKKFYYTLRKQYLERMSSFDRASRFVYLNRYCFNGLYRTNSRGQFNVPRGSGMGRLPSEKAFYRCAIALRNAVLECRDFTEVALKAKRRDFVYLDPPYWISQGGVFLEYTAKPFAEDDFGRLLSVLDIIDKKGAYFLLSYADTDEVRSILSKWRFTPITTPRSIAGFADTRQRAKELLVCNYPKQGE
jgi:DNA adenine methylase